jgi:flavin-dependent dehydrogenase
MGIVDVPGTVRQVAQSLGRRLPSVYRGRFVLVAEASGSVDAITGEGLRLGFEQSLALAQALTDRNLKAHAAHRKLAKRPSLMSAQMLGWAPL